MSTLIATLSFYRPLSFVYVKNPFLRMYFRYRTLVERFVILSSSLVNPEKRAINLGYLEKEATEYDGQDASPSAREASLLDDTVGSGYPVGGEDKGSKDNDGKSKRNKKGKIIGGIAGGLVGIVFAVGVAVPGFILNQIRDILTGKINDLQTRQTVKYRRAKLARVSDVFSRDGRMGSKVMQEMELRGYKFHFGDPTDRNKVTGLSRPDGTGLPNNNLGAVGAEISDHMERRHPFRLSRWKTRRMEAFYKRYGVSRASVITATPNDLENPDETVNRNMYKSVSEESYDPAVQTEELADDATDTEKRNKAAKEGIAKGGNDFEVTSRELAKGTPVERIGRSALVIEELGSDALGENVADAVKDAENKISGGSQAFGVAKGAFTGADFADRICTVKNRLRAAVTATRNYRAIAMMKYATTFIGASDGMRKGKADGKLMGSLLKRLTSTDKNGNSLGSSSGFGYALKKKFSKSKNDSTKSGYGVDAKLTGWPAAVQDKTNIKGCSVYQNPVFQVGVGLVEIGLTIITGGGSKVATTGIRTAVVNGFRKAVEKGLVKTLAKGVAKTVGRAAVIELSFEGIMILTQMYAERTLSSNFTAQEKGGQLGEILVGGAGTMAKQRNLMSGQVPATVDEYAQAYDTYLAEKKAEQVNQNFFARIFDYSNLDSLAFNTAATVSPSIASVGSSVQHSASSLLGAPATIFSTITRLVNPRVYAVEEADEIAFDTYTTDEDSENPGIKLATDPAGNLQTIMRTDVEEVDHEENIAYLKNSKYIDQETLEPIGTFKTHVTNCVEAVDTISRIEGGDPSTPEDDCLAKLDTTVRFKAHLAYLDMMDSLEAEFTPESLNSGGAPDSSLVAGTPITGQHTDKIPCPSSPTVRSGRIEPEAYVSGQRYSIQICNVHGIDLNTIAAKNFDDLFTAMKNAGYTVSGSNGFRDMESQKRGYADGAGAGTFSKPGFSNHQFGTAVDISCQGGGTEYRAGNGRGRQSFLSEVSNYPCLEWVYKNSFTHGLLLQCAGQGANGEIRANSGGCEWWHLSPTGG